VTAWLTVSALALRAHTAAQLDGYGQVPFSDPDQWTLKPEKVLSVRAEWAKFHPVATIALTCALLRAGKWANDPTHPEDLIRILARQTSVNAPWKAIETALSASEAGLVLDPQIATFP
jgi:ABC-type nitrate/sulfonate/bicarbonate transport system substrate-binding protein